MGSAPSGSRTHSKSARKLISLFSSPAFVQLRGCYQPSNPDSPKRRRRFCSTAPSDGSQEQTRHLIRNDESAGLIKPRPPQMHPRGFHISSPHNHHTYGESGPQTLAVLTNKYISADPRPQSAPKRNHKKISTETVKQLAAQSAEQDQKSLKGADALYRMMQSPLYLAPLLMEEEFNEQEIRCARRGLRWVPTAR